MNATPQTTPPPQTAETKKARCAECNRLVKVVASGIIARHQVRLVGRRYTLCAGSCVRVSR